MSTSTQERSFEPDPIAVRGAREFALDALDETGDAAPDEAFVERVLLVVSELATNAVLHARTPFVVRMTGGGGSVRVAVFDTSAGRPEPGAPDPAAVTGRGLGIVDALASAWGVEAADGGKWVWAEVPAEESGA
jgi:anti-sigma regulatory factor (Ser/Thr protein kinase)